MDVGVGQVKRVLRDIDRSGQQPEEILQQISSTVYPMYKVSASPHRNEHASRNPEEDSEPPRLNPTQFVLYIAEASVSAALESQRGKSSAREKPPLMMWSSLPAEGSSLARRDGKVRAWYCAAEPLNYSPTICVFDEERPS
jgi:hypothetical protein